MNYSFDTKTKKISSKKMFFFFSFFRYGWFWGSISRHEAQQRLHGTPNGSFLVRNSQINLYNYTISFRTAGKTLHYRIEFVDGYW